MRSIVLAIILSFAFILPAFAAENASTFDRVMKSGTIRCGYPIWMPVIYKDAQTGELKGLLYDLMQEAGKRLE
ncbi:MAG: hypothetical protein ACT4OY_07645 [Alphaproteobacteria bacterium]